MTERQKFAERKIVICGELQRETAINALRNMPVYVSSDPLEVVIRERVKVRGLDANGYYWLRLGEIAKQAWFNNRQYNSDVWHEYAKRQLMQDEVTTKDGERVSKWIESPDGVLTVISTTLLERKCFAEYTTIVEAFGGSLGVEYSADPRSHSRRFA